MQVVTGCLGFAQTSAIQAAEDVGWSANQIVLGKHSGRTAFRERMASLGIEFGSDAELNVAFGRFKDLADKKHEIFDDDLQVLVGEDASKEENDLVRFIGLKTMAETGSVPVAELSLELDGQPLSSRSP